MVHLEDKEAKKAMLQKKKAPEPVPYFEEYHLQDLFPGDNQTELEAVIHTEKAKLKSMIQSDFFSNAPLKSFGQPIEFKDKLDMFKYQEINRITGVTLDAKFLDKVTFIKIVNEHKLIFLATKDARLLIYNRDTERGIIENTGDEVTCMDYDPISNMFVLGHKYGKFSFAKWEKGRLVRLERTPHEGYSNDSLKKIKFILGPELIVFLTDNNVSELLVRLPGNKNKYKIVHLMNYSKRPETYYDICNSKLMSRTEEVGKNIVTRVTLLVGLFSSVMINFVSFDAVYENNIFKDADMRSVTFPEKIEKPLRFINAHSDDDTATSKSDPMDGIQSPANSNVISQEDSNGTINSRLSLIRSRVEKPISGKQETIVLVSNKQWLIESQTFVIVIWENIIEQYFITEENKFILSFRTILPVPIIAAYLGAVEYLVALSANLDLWLISVDKLRFSLESKSIFMHEEAFSVINPFTAVSSKSILVGTDSSNKGLAIWADDCLQYFQIFEWENYLQNLQGNSYYLEALILLSRSIKGQHIPLHGLLYPNGSIRHGSAEDLEEYKYFSRRFKEKVVEVISIMLESLGNKSGIMVIMEICLELLIKTKNFELLYDEFMGCVLEGHYKDPNLAKVFFQQLAMLFENNKLIEQVDVDFFVKIFEFSKTKHGMEYLERFLFFVIHRFKLNQKIFDSVKVTAFNKKLNLLLFFVLLHDPLSSDNLGYLLYQVMEFSTFDEAQPEYKTEFTAAGNRLFSYVYDIFTDQSYFSIDEHMKTKVENLGEIQDATENWLMSASVDFLLEKFPAKTIFLLNYIYIRKMNKQLAVPHKAKTSQFFLEEGTPADYDAGFNAFFVKLFTSRSNVFGNMVCILNFYYLFKMRSIHRNYFLDLLTRLVENFDLEKNLADTHSSSYLEYMVVKVALLNRNQIVQDAPTMDKIHKLTEKTDLAKLIELYLKSEKKPFFNALVQKDYFFNAMHFVFLDSNKNEIEIYTSYLKESRNMLMKKNLEKFRKLLETLPAEFLLSFAGQFKEDPKLQLRLFQALDERGESYEMKEENAAYYLSLLCLYNPEKVIPFLEKNATMDINKKLTICQQNNNQRGTAFILFKMADYQNALNLYMKLLRDMWEQYAQTGEAKEQIPEIIEEMLSFQVENSLYKSIILELIVLMSNLSGDTEGRREIIKDLFRRLFSMQCLNLVQDIKQMQDYSLFITDHILATNLLSNFKNLTELNTKISNLLNNSNIQNKDMVLRCKREGISLINFHCQYCGNVEKESESTYIFHRCKSKFHLNCFPFEKLHILSCKACSEKNLGKITRNILELDC